MKVETTRKYEIANGYSSGGFLIQAKTENKKIIDFTIDISNKATPDLMRLLSKDLLMFAARIEAEENGKSNNKG